MPVLISMKTATSKCQHRQRQPTVDRNRCAAGTTLICAVPSAAAADDDPANIPQPPDEPMMFATSGKAGMRRQLAIQQFGKGWQSMTQSCSRNFLGAIGQRSCNRFSRLNRHGARNIHADDVICFQRSYARGSSFAHFGPVISDRSTPKDLTCMTGTDDVKINEGELVITPRDSWLDKVRTRPSPKQQGLPRHDHVLTIDLVSPTMAYVKLKCAIPPRFFTDQLSLLKIDGRWQIAQKVFTTEMRE